MSSGGADRGAGSRLAPSVRRKTGMTIFDHASWHPHIELRKMMPSEDVRGCLTEVTLDARDPAPALEESRCAFAARIEDSGRQTLKLIFGRKLPLLRASALARHSAVSTKLASKPMARPPNQHQHNHPGASGSAELS